MSTYQHRIRQYWRQLRHCRTLYAPAAELLAAEEDPDVMRSVDLLVLSPAMNAYVIWLLRRG